MEKKVTLSHATLKVYCACLDLAEPEMVHEVPIEIPSKLIFLARLAFTIVVFGDFSPNLFPPVYIIELQVLQLCSPLKNQMHVPCVNSFYLQNTPACGLRVFLPCRGV